MSFVKPPSETSPYYAELMKDASQASAFAKASVDRSKGRLEPIWSIIREDLCTLYNTGTDLFTY